MALALIFSLLFFPEPFHSVKTSEWPEEAQAILSENFPHGPITNDQWTRLRKLDKEKNFMTSHSVIFWKDILSGWWWFIIFLVPSLFLLNKEKFRGAHVNVAFMIPSVLVFLLAVIFS